jgi:5'-3' exonuclease
MSNVNRLFIVDITDCFYQQWTIEDRPLIINDHFISRFSNKILAMSNAYQSSHAVAVADATKSWREEVINGYSFQGKEIPFDVYKSLVKVDKKLQEGGWGPMLRRDGMEAIDMMWRIIESTKNKDTVVKKVISSDKRLLSWVGTGVEVESYFVKYETDRIKDQGWLAFKMGVKPDQVSDFLSLSGYESKNIKGVAGIGPKKAKLLLTRFGTLEGVIKHVGEIGGQLGCLVEEYKNALKYKNILLGKNNIDLKMSFSEIKIKDKDSFKNKDDRYI